MTNAEITRAVIALDLEARYSVSKTASAEIEGQSVCAQVHNRNSINGSNQYTLWTLGGDRIPYSRMMDKLLASAS